MKVLIKFNTCILCRDHNRIIKKGKRDKSRHTIKSMLIVQEKYQTSKMKAEEAIYLMDTNQVNRLNQGLPKLKLD